MAKKRIGILTGGGDVPGLNSVIKTVTYRSSENDIEVVGLRRGWEALTHLNLEDPNSRRRYVISLDRENTRTIDRRGGTVLHSSRTNPSKMEKLPDHLASQDFPSTEGTPGTSPSKCWRTSRRWASSTLLPSAVTTRSATRPSSTNLASRSLPVPKTMDNDVHNTEYCIGFSTAITRASDAIQRQRTTVGSHERIGIFRIFGRDAGFTALYTAYVTSIRCVVPEYKVNLDKLIRLLIEEKRANPSNYALVVLSEGAEWEGYQVREYGEADAYGHRKKASVAESLGDEIKRRTGEETIVSDLTYDLRSGDPDFVDKLVGLTFGNMAYDAMLDGKTGLMSALVKGCYELVPIPDPKLGPRKLDVATMYNTERYRPNYANKRGLPAFLQGAS